METKKANWKYIAGLLSLTLFIGGGIIFWYRFDFPEEFRPHQYFVCPDGSHHGPGIPKEGVEEWCESNGHGGEKYCTVDSDCVCGVHEETEDCFIGNKKYAKDGVVCQWPDFCSGISGKMEIECVDNQCKQVRTGEEVTEVWLIYENEEYGVKVDYPGSWDIEELEKSGVAKLALDPEGVLPEEPGLDRPLGLITIYAFEKGSNSFVIGYDKFNEVKIGRGDKIEAKRYEEVTGSNEPNPVWNNKHVITYYFAAKKNDLRLRYVSDLDDEFLPEFNRIVRDLELVN